MFPRSYLVLGHAKTIGKQNVFVACLHHARQPVHFCEKSGLVVESGAVFNTTLWAPFPRTDHKTPRSISPIGNIPARAAKQTRRAPSWHKQFALRQVFTYVRCVHMRSAATPVPVPKPCNIRGSIRPLKKYLGSRSLQKPSPNLSLLLPWPGGMREAIE